MFLIFDTETTGLPISWDAPITDTDNWPRLVQIAWILYDRNGKELNSESFIVEPEDFDIPQNAEKVHGISTRRALKEGYPLEEVLNSFLMDLEKSDFLIAHNIDFDEKVVQSEFYRLGIHNTMRDKNKICTMKSTSEFCMIPGAYGFKFPKLAELYYILFGREFTEAHDASLDVRITAKCFWALMNKGFYSNISSLEKNKSKWGSNIPNRSELLSSELFTSNWKKWEFSQLLPVKTISKNLVFIYFENGLVTTDKHLFDDNVFDHPTVFDDLVIEQIFDEGGLGIWLKGEKSEYMVNSEGITFWRRAETGENDKSLRIVSFSSNTKIVTFNNTLKTTKEHLIEKRDIIFTFKNKVLEPINPYYHTYEYIKVKQGFKGYTNKEGLTFWFRE